MTRLTLDRRTSETMEDKEMLGGVKKKKKRHIFAELNDKLELGVVCLSHLGRAELHHFLFPSPWKECSSQEASSFN